MTDTQPTSTDIPGLEFIRYVLSSIVEDKDALVVDGTIDSLGILITVRVCEKDMGKLIGRGGQTVKALRTLVRILGGNAGQRINIKVLEPQASL